MTRQTLPWILILILVVAILAVLLRPLGRFPLPWGPHISTIAAKATDDAARFVRGSPPELGARKSADIEIIVMGAAIFAIAWAVLNPKTSAQVIVAVLGVVSLSNQSL
jgi:hypothetical protein